jgi:ribosomal protein S18 acetylase RimI-like enzyme
MSSSLKIQRIQSDTDPAFAELVKIYTESLPENERKNAGLLSSMIQRSEYLFLVACRDNSVVGFSIALCFHDSDAALLEYIAVARDCRGREIGKFLFKETAGMKEVSERHLLVEVDSDREIILQKAWLQGN